MEIYGPRSSKMSNNEKRLEEAILRYDANEEWAELFATEQVQMPNPFYPDYPYFIDFRICLFSAAIDSLIFAEIFIEADDNYFHINNRDKDLVRDIVNLQRAPTVRFDSGRIYREADNCCADAVGAVYHIFMERLENETEKLNIRASLNEAHCRTLEEFIRFKEQTPMKLSELVRHA